MVSLRDVVHYDVLHASLTCRTGDDFSHALSIAVHGAVADNEARLRLVLRHLIIHHSEQGFHTYPQCLSSSEPSPARKSRS
ncbi:Uncharacterised protein [Segatella copri]|nr:Uncharacterised protein [Segatella copri]